jgi:hypothetical protein
MKFSVLGFFLTASITLFLKSVRALAISGMKVYEAGREDEDYY